MVNSQKRKYKIKKKRSLLKSRLFWSALLTIVGLTLTADLILFSPFLQINEISVSGNERIPATEIQNSIWPEVEKSFPFGLKSRSILLADPPSIKTRLLEKFPLIDGLSVKRLLPKSLVVEIGERKTVSLWCWEINCFALDKNGVIFEAASEGQAGLVIKSKQPKNEISIGKKVMEEKILEQILFIQQTMSQKAKIEAKEFTLFENDQRLNAKTNEGWEVFFDLKGDVNWPLVELELVLEKELPQEKRGSLEYIDLRFNKVYYK
ncbi:MAG: hypothetical protein A2117_00220 [Candidatus Wildermuthbacteria bacterium GWA2_46_15]|uniref:POTRA domain-containing protein n=1 Tax=Candidatus Wildermuthbacteria bacterium GWA2_46_15 TaxID=1802443 RepID=A0A1G2QMX6_9BACT|nr:MAG: hypothetical protein A2117_00220 [Candidatus Wildermuthbacteria bacterium GWA2_46_15]